jgi:hypothetical protein
MLFSISSSIVEGLWIGFGFFVLLSFLIAIANIYGTYRIIRAERERGIYTALWKQPNFWRVLGTCICMFDGLWLIFIEGRGGVTMLPLLIVCVSIEIIAFLMVILSFWLVL